MSGNKRNKGGANNPPSKKSKTQAGLAQSFKKAGPQLQYDALNSKYAGARVLLKANVIYNKGKLPKEERNYCFQYHVEKLNEDDHTTAKLIYDGKFVRNGGDTFENYPDELDGVIENYRVALFKEDHELYNQHIARVNAKKNDASDMRKAAVEKQKKAELDDVSDIDERIHRKDNGEELIDVLEDEFAPKKDAEIKARVIKKGKDRGRVIYTQSWGECA